MKGKEIILKSSPLESLLCCPLCKSSLIKSKSVLLCVNCDKSYLLKDGIYYFNNDAEERESGLFKSLWVEKIKNIDNFTKPNLSQYTDFKEIYNIAAPLNNKVLLDAGCGSGLSTVYLLNKGVNIFFIDIIPEALEFIQKLIEKMKLSGTALFIVGDITNLPIKSNSMNIVWSGGVLEHFHSFKKPYVEFYRVLKYQGDLIYTIPNKFGLQRILSSIKEKIYGSIENHYETGFIYFHLDQLFPKKFFEEYSIKPTGIEQTFYDLFLPALKIKLPFIIFLLYKNILLFVSKISSSIKFGISWFLLSGKKAKIKK